MTMNDTTSNEGATASGVDASKDRRPGVPMEQKPPRPIGNAHWQTPPQQEQTVQVLTHTGIDHVTPVFSNAIPPRLLSGAIRRAAYRVPDYAPSHWMMLILADRIDKVEHQILKPSTWLMAGGAVGAWMLLGKRRKRSLLDRLLA